MEWLITVVFVIFILTFIPEFKKISYSRPRFLLPGAEDFLTFELANRSLASTEHSYGDLHDEDNESRRDLSDRSGSVHQTPGSAKSTPKDSMIQVNKPAPSSTSQATAEVIPRQNPAAFTNANSMSMKIEK
jgi:hypothetical protein